MSNEYSNKRMNERSKIMAEQMTATVRLETGMRFDAEAGSGHHVTLDAAETKTVVTATTS